MMRERYARPLGAVFAAAVLLAACGGGGDTTAGDTATDTATATEADTGAATPTETEAAAAADVAVGETDLGDALVDADGMTLYLFTNDSDGESTCSGDCAANWPPLTVDGEPAAGEGVDASLLGTTERDDGSTQVTYNGWPLYTFTPDQAPGETNGQGVGDVWFVIGPDGEALESGSAQGSVYDY